MSSADRSAFGMDRDTHRTTVFAPAKLNLVLAVGQQREDGYHELVSVMQKLDLEDRLDIDVTLDVAELGGEVVVDAPDIAGGDTLVTGAVEALLSEAQSRARVWVTLEKSIPVGAGLGGGSSDAAAALVAINKRLVRPLDQQSLVRLAATIGSDVPFFMDESADAMIVAGRGETVIAMPTAPATQTWLLAWPRTLQSTAAVYGAYQPAGAQLPAPENAARAALAGEFRNDLTEAALATCSQLARLHAAVCDAGGEPLVAGSGSTLAVPFDDQREFAAYAAVCKTAVADCWITRVHTRGGSAR